MDEKQFPAHKCGMYLTHNEHRDLYQSAEDFIADRGIEFADDVARQRAIDTGEIWTLQWYPDTPVGFYVVAAPTLAEVLALASPHPTR
jgi:hypothetical protein